MITFTPLSGSCSSSPPNHAEEPLSYLLQVDEVRVLLDLGGYDPRKPSTSAVRSLEYEEKIRELSPTISLVLLSHSQSNYLSLYPYARAHWGLKCPVYATQPTVEMGRVVCLEEVLSWRDEVPVEETSDDKPDAEGQMIKGSDPVDAMEIDGEGKDEESNEAERKRPLRGPFICTAEQVNEAFNWIKAIRYNQPVHMSGSLSHLLLTPYSSGHTLGGTVFKIRSPTSGTIVYAVGLNHTTERHLDATVLLPGAAGKGAIEGLQRPDLLIAEGGRSAIVGAKQKDKAKALLDLVTTTLQSGRSLLFPVDPSPRLLELLILLDQHWSYQLSQDTSAGPGMGWQHPLCLVSRTAHDMLGFARSLIEWMGSNVAKEEEEGDKSGSRSRRKRGRAGIEWTPLNLRHIRFFPNADALMRAFPRDLPKLVMAVPISMNYGSSRMLFKSMAADKGNVIVLTGRSERNSLTHDLFERWDAGQGGDGARYGAGQVGTAVILDGKCRVTIDEKVPLLGAELEQHLEAERQALEKNAATKAAAERSRRMLEADDLESDSDSDASSADGHLDGDAAGQSGDTGHLFPPSTGAGDAFAETDDVRATSFDIYVKGQQTRAAGFFRSGVTNVGAQERFRMFPFVEKKGRRVDVYGENLDVGAWLRKGREIELEVEPEEVREAKKRKKEEAEKLQQPPEPPSKYVHEEFDVDLAASVAFIDMEGQHDGRAIKTIISMLNPRRLIVVKSSQLAQEDLALALSASVSAGFSAEADYPQTNQQITIGEQMQQWNISLSEAMMAWVNGTSGNGGSSAGKWSKYEDFDIAMVTGRVVRPLDATAIATLDLPKQREAIESLSLANPISAAQTASMPPAGVESEHQPTILAENGDDQEDEGDEEQLPDVKPFYNNVSEVEMMQAGIATSAAISVLPQSMYIGDLRLTALKATLTGMGIPSEFVGEGTLLCGPGLEAFLSGNDNEADVAGGLVVIRKNADGRIELEGALEGDDDDNTGARDIYAEVQAVVYGTFARVVV